MTPATRTEAQERVSANLPTPWLWEHLARYRWAADFVSGQSVLDVACGTGYGAAHMRNAGAADVVGVDIEFEALASAERDFGPSGLSFVQASGTRLPFADTQFDVITSFETIEHLVDREAFARELARVVSGDGYVLLSTPNALHTKPVDGIPTNPHHVYEYHPTELRRMLLRFFGRVQLLGQHIDPGYGHSPYWQMGEPSRWQKVRSLTWRVRNRLFSLATNESINAFLRLPHFVPHQQDWIFSKSSVEEAHVTVAVCRFPTRALEDSGSVPSQPGQSRA